MIVLRYLLEYTPGEIAELLELPRGTVNSRLRRGLDALKEQLRVKFRGARRGCGRASAPGRSCAPPTRSASRSRGRAATRGR